MASASRPKSILTRGPLTRGLEVDPLGTWLRERLTGSLDAVSASGERNDPRLSGEGTVISTLAVSASVARPIETR